MSHEAIGAASNEQDTTVCYCEQGLVDLSTQCPYCKKSHGWVAPDSERGIRGSAGSSVLIGHYHPGTDGIIIKSNGNLSFTLEPPPGPAT